MQKQTETAGVPEENGMYNILTEPWITAVYDDYD